MLKYVYTSLCLIGFVLHAQAQDLSERLNKDYSKFNEQSVQKRRIKYDDLKAFLSGIEGTGALEVNKAGTSIEGRNLYLISLGEGDTDVFLWSQMHGDESTATMAILDMINFFRSDAHYPERATLLKQLRIHFLPMLNPDGAQRFTRRNRLGIDMNRDAMRLQSPESRTLKRIRDSLEADFGFNLHDQSRYYNALRTPKPATISFLAPAYNYEKSINTVRGNAMRVIAQMNRVLQTLIPGQVGRYNDDFEPRAFGDNIQKWGTSTILIESGGQYTDPEKQEIRKLNFIAILNALYSIATEVYKQVPVDEYFEIPNNDRKLFDLKLTGMTYELMGENYILDVGIQRNEVDNEGHHSFFYKGSIADLGDLSTFYGYRTIDAKDLKYVPATIYPETLENIKEIKAMNVLELIKQGYGYLRVNNIPADLTYTDLPMHVLSEDHTPDPEVIIGNNPSFFLANKKGELLYYVCNGTLIDIANIKKEAGVLNALIMR
ncbi:M14 family metallopeptidase [Robertkochia sediminum]|uniref:M14 family metallopeptidase n=1 Tax=Robertkochia sediminum TaxID=2785326 RepID=UPI001932A0EF|nr:M14 metallopeptidase family protein [Robertkochia sediminum]MBL7472775.1 peptidase M14 [Robertkochia sediminum]